MLHSLPFSPGARTLPGRADLAPWRPDVVAADLDGTLLPPDLVFDAELAPAVAGLQGAGVLFVICTGRMFRSVRKVAADLGLTSGLVVCYQGAMVADLGTGKRVWHRVMDQALAAGVVREARRMGRHLNAYIDDRLYVEELDDWALQYAEYAEVGVNQVDDLAAAVAAHAPTKLVLTTGAADVEAILPGLQRHWRGRLFVTRSQAEYIEFVDADVSKSRALDWLCREQGLRQERSVACGDGMNDVDMLRWAGLGVAVAESAPQVRASADLVVPRAELPALFRQLAGAPR
jgi:Cof subfamily protein (haloacid dehalogenase superfamily)